ncbi:MAG: hypothetical protein KME23_01720 [Goleter apudmare HA4340-LM2]|jgi:hypothetical protein|nr:hypothetical protein [Goleter apudmare HA4340-LM2]
MRVKLVNVLTVCVVTLAVLSPALLVFSVVWGKHIELVETQSSACEINKDCVRKNTSSSRSKIINHSQYQASIQNSTHTLEHQRLTVAEQYQLAIILQWVFFLIPIFFGVGIIIYDRYLVYRAAVFKEQVAMLEKLWQQSIEQ